jgi:hypothetical protein
MDTHTLLIVIAVSALVLIAIFILAFKSQGPRRIDRSVEATITQIQVESGTVSSWWIVTAQWLDPQTGSILTFRSRRLKFPPHQQIGERIAVHFETNEPKHYRMEL